MSYPFTPGNWRKAIAVVHMALACYLGDRMLGGAGFGVMLAVAIAWWRRQAWAAPRLLWIEGELLHYWQAEQAIAFKFSSRPWQWICADEVSPAVYAELRRYAKLHLVRQPVGLSISR